MRSLRAPARAGPTSEARPLAASTRPRPAVIPASLTSLFSTTTCTEQDQDRSLHHSCHHLTGEVSSLARPVHRGEDPLAQERGGELAEDGGQAVGDQHDGGEQHGPIPPPVQQPAEADPAQDVGEAHGAEDEPSLPGRQPQFHRTLEGEGAHQAQVEVDQEVGGEEQGHGGPPEDLADGVCLGGSAALLLIAVLTRVLGAVLTKVLHGGAGETEGRQAATAHQAGQAEENLL